MPDAPPLQQPLGQVVASHVQLPVVWSQTPFAHDEHAAPPVPHDVGDSEAYGSHVPFTPPLQQPFGHDVELHSHTPAPSHPCPLLQAPQVAPPLPQEPLFWLAYATHWPVPSQHPFGHELASHTQVPPLHSCPAGHETQTLPVEPHWLLELPVSQVLAEQQPAHAEPLQVHAPLVVLHAWPEAQLPQAAPPAPHSLAFWLA